MSVQGYYYLHTNGSLIYKRELGGTAADLRESSFVRTFWPFDPSQRELAWQMLVEALAAGADADRVAELAAKWGCDNEDAMFYADYVGFRVATNTSDSDWWASRCDFINLQESPSGWGSTALEAIAELAKELGYKPSKMWGASFRDLVRVEDSE